jgi:hypothetical protein
VKIPQIADALSQAITDSTTGFIVMSKRGIDFHTGTYVHQDVTLHRFYVGDAVHTEEVRGFVRACMDILDLRGLVSVGGTRGHTDGSEAHGANVRAEQLVWSVIRSGQTTTLLFSYVTA